MSGFTSCIQGRLAAAREKYGRDIRVFETSLASATPANVSDMGMYG